MCVCITFLFSLIYFHRIFCQTLIEKTCNTIHIYLKCKVSRLYLTVLLVYGHGSKI